jgi:RecA-family ATPase
MTVAEEILKEFAPNSLPNASRNKVEEVTGDYLLHNCLTEIDTLLNPLCQRVGVVCLAGSSDTGKSAMLRQLAIAIVLGLADFLGFIINAIHKSVVFVSSEDDASATSFLLNRQAKGYEAELLRGLRFIFETDNILQTLDESLTKKPADLIILDCFADLYGHDLKDTQRIRTFLNQFQQLAVKHQCLFLFLHHTGKRTEHVEPSKNNLLSGQGFEAKMRLVMELRADNMNPNERHLCIVKGNYLPSNMKRESYVLNFDEQTFCFTNTGKRMQFEFLAKKSDSDNGKAKYEQAEELRANGDSYEVIAEKLGFGSKGTVSKLFKKAESEGWNKSVSKSVSIGNDGNDMETPF